MTGLSNMHTGTGRAERPAGSSVVTGRLWSVVPALVSFVVLCVCIAAVVALALAYSRLAHVAQEDQQMLDTALFLERTVYETAHHAAQYAVSGDMRHYSGVRIRLAALREALGALENETRHPSHDIAAETAKNLTALREHIQTMDTAVEERRSAMEHLILARNALTEYSRIVREAATHIVRSPNAAKEDVWAAGTFALAAERITGLAVSAFHGEGTDDLAELAEEIDERWEEAKAVSANARKAGTAKRDTPQEPVAPSARALRLPKNDMAESWQEMAGLTARYKNLLLSLNVLVRQKNLTLEEREESTNTLALASRALTDSVRGRIAANGAETMRHIRVGLAALAVTAMLSLGLCVSLAAQAIRRMRR